jgi:hypothetical protein
LKVVNLDLFIQELWESTYNNLNHSTAQEKSNRDEPQSKQSAGSPWVSSQTAALQSELRKPEAIAEEFRDRAEREQKSGAEDWAESDEEWSSGRRERKSVELMKRWRRNFGGVLGEETSKQRKWELAGANTCSREQSEQNKNLPGKTSSWQPTKNEVGAPPWPNDSAEREQNLLAQDEIRKENFSGKIEGSSVAPTKSTGQATKDRAAWAGFENEHEKLVHASREKKSSGSKIFHRARNKTKNRAANRCQNTQPKNTAQISIKMSMGKTGPGTKTQFFIEI